MNRFLSVSTLAALILMAFGQVRVPGPGGESLSVSPTVTPSFISSVVVGSTEWGTQDTATNSVTNLVTGTTTCGDRRFCLQFPDAILSGNGLAIAYSYSQTTAETPTISDDQGNSYTCITEVHDATNNRYLGACYLLDVTNAPRQLRATFPADVSYGEMEAIQIKDVISLDTSATGSGSGTTAIATSALSATAKDFVVQFVQITNPSNNTTTANSLGTITFGSGWSGFAANYRDGMGGQFYIPSSGGSITPSETDSISVSYIAAALAFKSGTQGTAPSGMHIACEWFTDSETAFADHTPSPTVQLPCPAGDTLVAAVNGGSSASNDYLSSVTDSSCSGSCSWFNANPVATAGGDTQGCSNAFVASGYQCTWMATNWTPSNTEQPTFNMNYNGSTGADVSIWAYAVVGGTSAPTNGMGAVVYSYNAPAGATYTLTSTYQPQSTSGITFVSLGTQDNTITSQSGFGVLDSATNGGENLDGPWPLMENNWLGHGYNTDNTMETWTEGLSSSTEAAGAQSGILVNLPAAGSVFVIQKVNCQGTANDLTCAITPKATSSSLIAVVGGFDGATRTLTSICNNGTTCGSGHAFTIDTGSQTTNGGGSIGYIAHWFADGLSGSQTFTAAWSGAMSNTEIAIYEVMGISAVNAGPAVTNSGSVSCPAVTPTVAATFVASVIVTSEAISISPASGSLFTAGSGIWSNTTDAWSAEVTTSTSAQTPTYTGGGTTGCATEAFQ